MKLTGKAVALAVEAVAMVGYAAVESAATLSEMKNEKRRDALEHIRSLENRLTMAGQLDDDDKVIKDVIIKGIKDEVALIKDEYKRILNKKKVTNIKDIAIKNELDVINGMLLKYRGVIVVGYKKEDVAEDKKSEKKVKIQEKQKAAQQA